MSTNGDTPVQVHIDGRVVDPTASIEDLRAAIARRNDLAGCLRRGIRVWRNAAEDALAERNAAYRALIGVQHRLTNAEIELRLEAHARQLRRESPMTFLRWWKRGRLQVVLVTNENCDASWSLWWSSATPPWSRGRRIGEWSSDKPDLLAHLR